jgi:flagellar hook-basal body complex protein FliE
MTDPTHMLGAVGPAQPAPAPAPAAPAEVVEGKDFKRILLDSLEEVNRLQQEADRGVQRLVTGETDNVAEVMHAVNKAGIAFDLLMEIRNKMTDAYREIQQMRI